MHAARPRGPGRPPTRRALDLLARGPGRAARAWRDSDDRARCPDRPSPRDRGGPGRAPGGRRASTWPTTSPGSSLTSTGSKAQRPGPRRPRPGLARGLPSTPGALEEGPLRPRSFEEQVLLLSAFATSAIAHVDPGQVRAFGAALAAHVRATEPALFAAVRSMPRESQPALAACIAAFARTWGGPGSLPQASASVTRSQPPVVSSGGVRDRRTTRRPAAASSRSRSAALVQYARAAPAHAGGRVGVHDVRAERPLAGHGLGPQPAARAQDAPHRAQDGRALLGEDDAVQHVVVDDQVEALRRHRQCQESPTRKVAASPASAAFLRASSIAVSLKSIPVTA